MPLVKFVGESEGQKRPKKQKLVKHRRKNWAKTDISDVERSIDDLRRQKLAGGILSEKKDEELFVINKKPIITKDELEAELESDKSVRRKGKKSLEEKLNNLSCYRNLKPDIISAPAHIVGHKKTPKPDSKRQAKIAETVEKKHKRKAVETKAKQAPKKAKLSKEKYDVLYETKPDDIWNGKKAPKEAKEESNPETENDYLKPTKKVLVNKPKNPLHVESRNPKLELPHPGMSYNPEYDDHQRLLIQAHEAELKKLKKEEKELKKLTTSVNKMSWKEIEDLWLEEMSLKQGIDEQTDEKDEEDESEKTSSLDSNKSSKKKKEAKLKKKRKQILQKLKQKQKDNEKKTRIQQSEIFRLKSLLKEINEEEKKREDKKLEKEIREKHRELFEPKRLGKVKFEAPDIDIKLSDELTGSLRTLKPEGNILMDSYKQLQKRNIIEPRERASKPKRRYGKKVFDKRNAHEKTYFIK